MAISWITAFKVIPWRDVIAAAPVVAEGAKKLWATARKKSPEPLADTSALAPADRLRTLETQTAELKRELTASAELIQSLADQNLRLVKAVDTLRFRTWILLVCCGLLLVAMTILFWR
ncbi:MAG: hypothetical protein ACREUW_21870 [Burkholderiales bacterium]